MKKFRAAGATLLALGLVSLPTAANAGQGSGGGGDTAVTTVAGGLDGPRQISDYRHHSVVVAESDSGAVASVDLRSGAVTTLLSGLYSPQGVAYDDGLLFIALGGAPPPGENAPQPKPGQTFDALVVARPDGTVLRTIDLLAYEKQHNPDGQLQFLPDGSAPDALSNPYSVFVQDRRILVADAGANDVLAIDRRTGTISTFFVPPVVTPAEVPACQQPENAPGTFGCDPVPTSIAQGPDGLLYVSTLGALTPGAARVYVLDQRGHVVRVIGGLDNATGVAVDGHGTVYVTDLLQGAPPNGGPPPAGFDPATVGQVVRIDRHGSRSYSQVAMPNGLLIEDGSLYATAWSIAIQVGIPSAGQVVRIGWNSFGPPAA
jgi:hypothetical protein